MLNIQNTVKTLAIIIGLMAALPAFGMQNNTFPCDNCHQEKEVLNRRTNGMLKTSTDYECVHVLCKECNDDIWLEKFKPKDKNDKVWWNCPYCAHFYNQHNKQCWQPKNPNEATIDSLGIGAARFKSQYPNRELSDVTDATILPRHPRDPQNPPQYGPAHQQHGNPPIPGNLVIDNNIKWLGAAGIVAIVCYGAYKAYQWYKGEEKKENDNEIDEWEDWEKEEAQPETNIIRNQND